MAGRRASGGGFGRFVLGFITVLLLMAVGMFVYFRFGKPPVAVADVPFPFERAIVQVPLHARIGRETKVPPFAISEDVFEAGARVYKNE